MKKQQFVNFILLFFILLIVIFAVVKLIHQTPEEKQLESKTEQEIKQLEDKIIAMMNHLNQISFSNFVLVEEKVQSNDSSSQEGDSQQQSSGSEQGSSKQQSSNDSNSKETSNQKENTKFELKNNGILTNTTEQQIDWNSIKSNIEILYATWPTVVVDLHELKVKNEDILNFSTVLDQVTLSAKQEDKTVTLNNLASLYAFLPTYRSQISEDNQSIHIDYVKACILNSYALVEQDKWEEMREQVTNAIHYFSNIMNSIEGNKQTQSRISKIYVLLNELNNSINAKDKDLYYIKYRNVMGELVNF